MREDQFGDPLASQQEKGELPTVEQDQIEPVRVRVVSSAQTHLRDLFETDLDRLAFARNELQVLVLATELPPGFDAPEKQVGREIERLTRIEKIGPTLFFGRDFALDVRFVRQLLSSSYFHRARFIRKGAPQNRRVLPNCWQEPALAVLDFTNFNLGFQTVGARVAGGQTLAQAPKAIAEIPDPGRGDVLRVVPRFSGGGDLFK